MDIIQYSEEHRIFRSSLKKYLEKEVIPHAEEWEEAGIVPRSAWKGMGEQGFLCMQVPEAYGGPGCDFLYSVIVTEELARTNQSGLAAPLHSDIVVPYIVAYGSEEQKHKYLPGCVSGDIITAIAMTEPNAGSDLAAIKTTVREDGDAFVINGQQDLHLQRNQLRSGHCRRQRPRRRPIPTRRWTCSLSKRGRRVSRKASASKKSAGTARTRRSCSSTIAGSPGPTAWGKKARDFFSSC